MSLEIEKREWEREKENKVGGGRQVFFWVGGEREKEREREREIKNDFRLDYDWLI